MPVTIDLAPLAAALRPAERLLLTTHHAPDGDGIGCMLALAEALGRLGKHVQLVSSGAPPPRFSFLPGASAIRDLSGETTESIRRISAQVDLVLVVDAHEWSLLGRLGEVWREGTRSIYFLDHHPPSRSDPAHIFCDPGAPSTGELCWQLLDALEVRCTASMATCVYAAIAYDTQMFRYLRGRASTHRVAAALIDAGAESERVYRHIFAANSPAKVALLGEVLQTLQLARGGRIAWAAIRREQIDRTGASRDDLRDMIVPLLEIEGVEVALTFKERDDGSYKVSLRSKGRIPVGPTAARLGGGGHAFAAGAHLAGPLPDATARLIEMLLPEAPGDPSPAS
ncbi:MAG: hypothetical protein GF330_01700 [Candidatus Eisenbacteria bacterium]|nr:hypothetical protein [Candidatus Eisenbacteria bacterium]